MQDDAAVPHTPPEDHESTLERVRERLYSQQQAVPIVKPSSLEHPQQPASLPAEIAAEEAQAEAHYQTWTPPEHTEEAEKAPKKKISFAAWFLLGSLSFLVLAGLVSFLVFWHGGLSVSSNNIQITISGPTTLASGSTVPLQITLKNNNPAPITNTDIAIAFPDGTRSADDVTQALLRYSDTFGTIPAGGTVTRTVNVVLFGSINQALTIPVTIQYNTANSNALFTKEQDFHTLITSSPLTLTADAAKTTSAGQLYTITLTVHSSATQPLQNIAIDAQYPAGFSVVGVALDNASTQLATRTGNPVYTIGTLQPGDNHTVTITGTLSGTTNDQKAFSFTAGTANTNGQPGLGVAYASQTLTTTLAKPFLDTSITLNHTDTDPTVVSAGTPISGLVTWVNSLTSSLSNGQVSIRLSGTALDPSKVSTANGYYQSSTNTLLFTPETEPSLGELGAGQTGSGVFALGTLPESAMLSLRNPLITLTAAVSGQPDGQSPLTLTNVVTKTIKVQTDLKLVSQIVHSTGPFKNSGAWPPVANKPTTYTVELVVGNTVNDVGGASATMILPPYVTYTGQVTPNDGSVTYNASTHSVTWKIGAVPAGTGSSSKPLTAAFQISFTPSDTQVSTSPVLVENQTLTGTDRFTNTQVGNTADALTSQTPGDPAYRPTFGTVVQ